ncbi:MAG: GAF domain-containing sensor histidine kinase [Nocardioidaceae bacterium]
MTTQEPDSSKELGMPAPSASLSSLLDAGVEDLLRELIGRVHDLAADQHRLRLLLDAVVVPAADLSLDAVLDRIAEVACALSGARYAALGVLDPGPGRRLQAFVTHGLSDQDRERIGDLPRGRGLLGQIIDRPVPLRLHDLHDHPSSFGFPDNHPPMRSFLGVPIRIRDRVFGNLYLTEKTDGQDFTKHDEAVVVALAAAAGVVIENARLYEEAARRESWLAATAEIANILATSGDAGSTLQVVADRAREIARADLSCVLLRSSETELEIAVASGVAATLIPTAPIAVATSLAGRVIVTGEVHVSADVATDERTAPEMRDLDGWPTLGPAMVVPLRTSDGVEGALALSWSRERAHLFHDVDVSLPQRFAEQAAVALQLARARAAQERLAVFEDRDRIGRDLHDLVIQRLFAIGLGLENTARLLGDRPEVSERLTAAVDDLDATIKDVRRSIFALSTAEESTDVRRAVLDLADRASRTLRFRPAVRFTGPVNSRVSGVVAPHLVAVLGEALSNVARHAHAGRVQVTLEAADEITLVVEDDGRGMAGDSSRSGLLNMRERAEDLGGSCTVESAPGRGTTLTWCVPAS